MKVLVTGGAGFIGSHTCKVLAEQMGIEPVVFDNLSSGHRAAVKWGALEVGNLSDTGAIRVALRRHRPSLVLHFAASAYVGESCINPGLYFRNNVSNGINLLDTMMEEGIKDIVFSSSCAVYGQVQSASIGEESPKAPINPYGESKLFFEHIMKRYAVAHGLRSVCLRYFNAAGADRDGDLGECHNPETHVLPLIIRSAYHPKGVFKVFGDNHATNDGTAVRDYVHVSDLAKAHVLAVDHLRQGKESVTLNLGTGKGISVRELIESVEFYTGRKVRVEVCDRREGDPSSLVANSDLSRTVLGWEPHESSLQSIVKTAVADYLSNNAWMADSQIRQPRVSSSAIFAGAVS